MNPLKIGSSRDVRRHHVRKVVEVLRGEGSIAKTKLAEKVSLSFSTVSTICNELARRKIILGQKSNLESGGRRPHLYVLNPNSCLAFCIDFSDNDRVGCGLVNLNNEVKASSTFKIDNKSNLREIGSRCIEEEKRLHEKIEKRPSSIVGVGIIITGIYDEGEQIVVNSSNPLLENVKLLDYLPGLHSRHVCIENESNLGALALIQSYKKMKIRSLIFIHIGPGLGCGILSQNQLLEGSRGYGAEIAHIPLLDTSVKCYCGKVGCIESLLSIPGILAHYNRKEKLTTLNYDRKELTRFIDAVESGEKRALSIIERAGSKMGQLAAILANIFDPEVIFLSGEVETLVELIFMATQPYFSSSLLLSQRRRIDFQTVKSIKELFYAGAAEKVFRNWVPFSN